MTLQLRPLARTDLAALQSLVESDPGYAERVTGDPPGPDEAEDLLTGRPADLAEDGKVVLGAFEGDELVAVADVLRGWPGPDQALIGLLQVHGRHQGRGLGRAVHDLLLAEVRSWPGVRTLRAAIVATNATTADPFWAAMGYAPTGDPRPYTAGSLATTVQMWTRPVRP